MHSLFPLPKKQNLLPLLCPRLLGVALALLLGIAMPACTNPGETKWLQTMMTSGLAVANWQKAAATPTTWTAGGTPDAVAARGGNARWETSGSLYTDYANKQAQGSGELLDFLFTGKSSRTGLKLVYKIHGMRQIRVSDTSGKLGYRTAATPQIIVFDGDFKVYQVTNGKVGALLAQGSSAYDGGGPDAALGEEGVTSFMLRVTPAGIQLRDGIQMGGFYTDNLLFFHRQD